MPAEQLRAEADARLATAQAPLDSLLRAARGAEDWFRSPEYLALLATAAAAGERALLERLRRGVVAVSATFHALRDARIFPASAAAVDEELERYWEQVYQSLDDAQAVADLCMTGEVHRTLGALPGGAALRACLDRLLEAARDYLASDGRRPLRIEPLVTDVDRRIHVVVESRHVAGVAPGKVVAVVRSGITREGRLVRRPEVVVSA